MAVVYTETEITPEVIKQLENYHDLAIKQKTPVRVLHRRSLLTRDKMIYVSSIMIEIMHYSELFFLFIHTEFNNSVQQ